jgi:glycosyltransferase involved in cell wall biosynthesis
MSNSKGVGARPSRRIVILNWMDPTHPGAGGAERYLLEVSKVLISNGFQVTWLTSSYHGAPTKETLYGATILRAGNRFTIHARGYFMCRTFAEPNTLLLEVIHAVPYLATRRPAVTVIFHLVGIRTLIRRLGLASLPVFIVQRFLMPQIYRDRPVITDGPSTRHELIQSGFRSVQVVPDGLTIEEFHVEKENVVVFTGPLKPWKRPADAIRAFSTLNSSWSLEVLGRFESAAFEGKINELVRELSITKRVHFRGFVSEEEKLRTYARAKLTLVTSEKEGWALPAIEAAAYGCVTVGYDVPGVRDAVGVGDMSILVLSGDVARLSAALRMLAQDSGLREKLSANGAARSRMFSWSRTGDNFLEALRATGLVETENLLGTLDR